MKRVAISARWPGALVLTLMVCVSGVWALDRIANAQIIDEIQDHLHHANVFKHGQVQVTVADGVAILSGKVDSVGVKMDAQNATMKDEDVVRVVNNIEVDTNIVTSNQIVEQAQRRLLTCYAYTVYDHVDFEAHGCADSIYLRRFPACVSRTGVSGQCWKRTGKTGRSAEWDRRLGRSFNVKSGELTRL